KAGTAIQILLELAAEDLEEVPRAPSRRLLSPTEFAQSVAQSEPVVDGLIYRPGVTLLVGAPGAGKSYVALDLSWAISSGWERWQGEPLYLQGRVAYLAAEAHSSLPRRLQALAKHHGAAVPEENLRLHSIQPLRLQDPDNMAELMVELEEFAPSFVVVD